jgi:2-dehydropantoate 2-reductase
MRIGIFGCGAIGGVIAGYLARAERDVVAVDPWFRHVEQIRRNGLNVKTIEEAFTAHPRMLHLDELDEVGTVDLAIVSTKAYDTRWMARLAERHLAADGTVLSAQNGMNEATLVEVFGAERTIGCVVPYGAEMWEPGSVRRTSSHEWGSLILGELDGPATERVHAVAAALEPVEGISVTDAIVPALWGKMTLNVMGNVVAGLTGYTTLTLWTDSVALDVQVALAHELAKVAANAGVVPDPVLKTTDHELLLAASETGSPAWEKVKENMTAVGLTRAGDHENVPSLGQDIRKGRRTEVDYLNGWVVRQAQAAGLTAPVNAAVVEAGRDRELGVLDTDPENIAPLHRLVEQLHGAATAARASSGDR